MATTDKKANDRTTVAVRLNDLLALLEQIDKRIISIDSEAIKSSSNERGLFLEGKSSGLNEVYRMIKQKFSI